MSEKKVFLRGKLISAFEFGSLLYGESDTAVWNNYEILSRAPRVIENKLDQNDPLLIDAFEALGIGIDESLVVIQYGEPSDPLLSREVCTVFEVRYKFQ